MSRIPLWMGAVFLAAFGCQAQGDGNSPGAAAGPATSPGAGASAGGAATSGGMAAVSGAATGGAGGVAAPVDCSQPRAATLPLSVLTDSQFNNTVLDILKVSGNPATGVGQNLDDTSLEKRAGIAATIASQAAASLSGWAPCTPPASGSTTACEQQIVDKVGAKLYRRPLTDTERSDMIKLFDAGVKEKDFATGVEWFLTGLLQSPYFVYQVVRPDASETAGDVRALSPYELASRLAYFIWDGPPDDALTQAATSGDLADQTKRGSQLSRMVQDPRFSRGVTQFYTDWLRIRGFRDLARDLTGFDENVVNGLSTSLLMSATELYKNPSPNLSDLFSGSSYYLNDALRTFYGVSGSGSGFTLTAMPNQGRSGVLTHPGVMALLARPGESFPIGRGVNFLRNIVCDVVELPANFTPPAQPPLQSGQSTRERLEAHTAAAFCQTCHGKINAAGFAFEDFDEVGRYRTVDHMVNVDTSGSLSIGKDVDGMFASGAELLAKLPQSLSVRACFAEKYLDFALAHPVTNPSDTCSIQAVGKSFGATGDLKQLVTLVAESDSFRLRLAEGVGK